MIESPLALSTARRRAVTIGVMTGMVLAALEATVIATAMPTVIAALGGMAHYSWVFSAYLLTSTVTVPVWGKLSDIYGRRLLYQFAVAIFVVGSVLSGMSTSMTQLIAARALQGLGAGGLVPLGMTIVGDIFTLEQRARMQGLFSGVWGLSSVVGPVVGGFITDRLSWRWVFYINVPFGVVAALIIGLALREPERRLKPKIDYWGAVSLTLAVTALMLAVVESETVADLVAPGNLALFAIAGAFSWLFLRIERRVADPIVPLGLFSNRVVSVAVSVGFLAGIGMFGAITFVPLFAQGSRGASATEAGSFLTPLMLAWVSMSVIGGRLLLRVGYRSMVITGLLFLISAFSIFALFGPATPTWWIMADLVLVGAGLGLTMLTLLLAVQHSVRRAQLGIATSLNQFSRTIGGAVGVAVMGALVTAALGSNLSAAAATGRGGLTQARAAALAEDPRAAIDPGASRELSAAQLAILREALGGGLRRVFIAAAIVSAGGLLIALRLPSEKLASRQRRGDHSEAISEVTAVEAEREPVCVD